MRFVFLNPHIIYGIQIREFITLSFNTSAKKYNFFLTYLQREKSAILSDLDSTLPFVGRKIKNIYLKRLLVRLEIYLWMIINKINPFKIPIYFSTDNLNKNNDLIFAFPFGQLSFLKDKNEQHLLANFSGIKIIHFTHYFFGTSVSAVKLKDIGEYFAISEANLSLNAYYQKFFPKKDFYILPFVIRDKYKNLNAFENRKNKCFAVGTIHSLKTNALTQDFISFFNTDYLHEMRKKIFILQDQLVNFIDSYIHLYSTEKELKTPIKKIVANFGKKQKDYFSFDIVEKYNEYKMFTSAEELTGTPSINFVEGMACGCAYLGLESRIYTDLGLQSGIHYIAHDGTIEDLIKKIDYYQHNLQELAEIANNGYLFVKENFLEKTIVEKFKIDLLNLQKNKKFICSFIHDYNHKTK